MPATNRPIDEPADVGRQCRRDRREAVERYGELEYRLAAKAVGELALSERAEKQSEQGGAADRADAGRRREMRAHHIRHQRTQDDEVDDVEEQPDGDDRQHALVNRPEPRVVERLIDIGHDRLRHCRLPPATPLSGVHFLCTYRPPPQPSPRARGEGGTRGSPVGPARRVRGALGCCRLIYFTAENAVGCRM